MTAVVSTRQPYGGYFFCFIFPVFRIFAVFNFLPFLRVLLPRHRSPPGSHCSRPRLSPAWYPQQTITLVCLPRSRRAGQPLREKRTRGRRERDGCRYIQMRVRVLTAASPYFFTRSCGHTSVPCPTPRSCRKHRAGADCYVVPYTRHNIRMFECANRSPARYGLRLVVVKSA